MELLVVFPGLLGFVGLMVFGLGFRNPLVGLLCFAWVPGLIISVVNTMLSGTLEYAAGPMGDDRPLLRWFGGMMVVLGYGSLAALWLLEPSLF